MSWTELLKLDPHEFLAVLGRRPASLMKYRHFVDLYNVLMKNCRDDAARSAALADAIAPFLRKRGLRRHALLFDEMGARAHMLNGEIAKACDAMSTMIDADKTEETRSIVLELAHGAMANSHTFGGSVDQRPEVFAAVSVVFRKLGRLEELGYVHLEAASVYSHHGAIQAAYRSVVDAEEIAHEIQSLPLLARALGQAASVACYERDYKWAIGAAEQALEVYKSLATNPPSGLLSNLAVAQLNTDQIDDALQTFQSAIAAIDETDRTLPLLLVNMAICLRRKGDLEAATQATIRARSLMPSDAEFDMWIELELGAAKLASEQHDYGGLTSSLEAAVARLDEGLTKVFRLHHRRGLREQYIQRFEGLLRAVPERGAVNTILGVFATLRGNALGDWLVLLEWAKVSIGEDTSPEEQQEVNRIIDQLRDFGAPHVFGFHEKYDDAWQPSNRGSTWDELSRLAGRLARRGIVAPFDGASLACTVARLQRRLAERHALIAVTYAGNEAMIWIMYGENYVRAQVPLEVLSRWKGAQSKFAVGELDRSAYTRELAALLDGCRPLLRPALAELAAFGPLSVRYLQEFDGGLPITPILLENEDLANSVAEGACEIRTVPALVFSQEESSFNPQTIVAINESSEDLLLPAYEGEAIAAGAGMRLEPVGTAKNDRSLGEVIGEAEALIVSTHGLPLGIFTDAIFAGMNEKHVISVAALQDEAAAYKLKLVILNACNSGTSAGRNFQKRFRTSDSVTFPSLFLLNRQAVVSASLWKVSDTASYVYACLVGDALARGLRPALALASSAASIKSVTKTQALTLLQRVSDPMTREAAIKRLTSAPEVGLFSNPYLYGAVALFGLL